MNPSEPTTDAQDVKDFYNSRYGEMAYESMRPIEAYASFLKHLPARPGQRLLDIACGCGFLMKTARDRGLEAAGLDISEQAVELARKLMPDARIEVGRAEELPFEDASFDYVTCLGSLEHFLDIPGALGEMTRVLKDDGRILLVVPNRDFIPWKLRRDAGTEQQSIKEELHSLREWQAIFEASQLKVESIHKDEWFRKSSLGRGALRAVKRPLARLAWSLIPARYDYQIIFICTK